MSKIDDLIKELCPDGVEFVCLDEVASLQRGSAITKKNITPGDVPVVAGGQRPAYFHSESNRSAHTVVVAGSGAYAGFVSFWSVPIFVSDAFSIEPLGDEVISKYIFYILKNRQAELHNLKRGSGVPHVYSRDVARWKIPVPPLEVQKEIVRVLDSFTELEAELEARKKQYEYYRNTLLTFNERVIWKSMGEIGKISMCKRIMKSQTSRSGDIPFYKIGTFGKTADAYISRELYSDYKSNFPFPKKGDILLSASGTIGRTVVYDGEPAYFQDSNIIWLENDESQVTNKFLYHLYKITTWQTEGGTIKRLYIDNFKRVKIPVPPLEKQKQIVSILDKFEKLTNDISVGLPAEIEARRKQYEYYRNKLLTFKELECSK